MGIEPTRVAGSQPAGRPAQAQPVVQGPEVVTLNADSWTLAPSGSTAAKQGVTDPDAAKLRKMLQELQNPRFEPTQHDQGLAIVGPRPAEVPFRLPTQLETELSDGTKLQLGGSFKHGGTVKVGLKKTF